MKKITFFVLAVLMTMVSFSQEIPANQVPAVVKQSFTNQFAGAKLIKYEKDNTDYIISFLMQDKQFIITFNNLGKVIASDKEITPEALPAVVSNSVKKNFQGYKIETVIKREAFDRGLCYEMDLKKGDAGYSVRFSDQGEILMKEPRRVEMKAR